MCDRSGKSGASALSALYPPWREEELGGLWVTTRPLGTRYATSLPP